MKLMKRKIFLVPVCPVCGTDKINMGSDSYTVFESRVQMVETLRDTDGETLGERVAYSCSIKCGDAYRHRHWVKKKVVRSDQALHFVSGVDVDWKKTARLRQRKDGRFAGVVERKRV